MLSMLEQSGRKDKVRFNNTLGRGGKGLSYSLHRADLICLILASLPVMSAEACL